MTSDPAGVEPASPPSEEVFTDDLRGREEVKPDGTGDVGTVRIDGQAVTLGPTDALTLEVDLPTDHRDDPAGGDSADDRLLLLSIAASVSNDLSREAKRSGIRLNRVTVRGPGAATDGAGDAAPSAYAVEATDGATTERRQYLVAKVDLLGDTAWVIRRDHAVRPAIPLDVSDPVATRPAHDGADWLTYMIVSVIVAAGVIGVAMGILSR